MSVDVDCLFTEDELIPVWLSKSMIERTRDRDNLVTLLFCSMNAAKLDGGDSKLKFEK